MLHIKLGRLLTIVATILVLFGVIGANLNPSSNSVLITMPLALGGLLWIAAIGLVLNYEKMRSSFSIFFMIGGILSIICIIGLMYLGIVHNSNGESRNIIDLFGMAILAFEAICALIVIKKFWFTSYPDHTMITQ